MTSISIKNVNLSFPKTYNKSMRAELIDKIIKKNNNFSFYSALKNINLTIKEGDKIGLVGSNGSGKTSLLKILAGIYYPNSGEISVDGSISTLIALTTGLDLEMNGLENIYLSSYLRGFKKKEIEKKINQIVEFSELGESIYKPTRVYSSGMLTRLSSSIFISFESDIMLLDEFISTGDKSYRNKLLTHMEEKFKKSKIVVFASHEEKMIDKLCNIKVTMQDGEIVKIEK